ncbi:MAG TPA: hypothetical protein VHR45_12205 [Thermoanaerobaculia bacterium]|nr:hypothetical protein [Thermoanaerobaculia bacterium]
MRKSHFAVRAGLVLALAASSTAAAAALQVIALHTRIDNLTASTSATFETGDGVPVSVGDQVKVTLVGAVMVNRAAVVRVVNAQFVVAAGGGNISLANAGRGWALVNVNAAGGNGLAQLGYTVVGDYQMHTQLKSGRITFKIGGDGAAEKRAGTPPPAGREESRWLKAQDLCSMLYQAILGSAATNDAQKAADADRIYLEGYGGVLSVAASLARRAEDLGFGRAPGERGYQERDIERVGGLYRDLLHRQQSNSELWANDGGFRNNVAALHEKRLGAVVDSVVDSAEFRTAHAIERFGPLEQR